MRRDNVEWEDENCDPLDIYEDDRTECEYQPFHMVQPQEVSVLDDLVKELHTYLVRLRGEGLVTPENKDWNADLINRLEKKVDYNG